jgi:TatA/E family protein of Tat protein translocase
MFGFIKNIGPTEIIVIAVILILLFGSRIVISLGRSAGQTFKEVKKVKNELSDAIEEKAKN